MEVGKLRIGIKNEDAATVPVQLAENVEDMQSLARKSVPVVLRCFNRGWRIECQERSGARDEFRKLSIAKKPAEEIMTACAKKVADYDPTAVVERVGRPKAPIKLAVKKGKKTFTADDVLKLLQDAGVKAEITEEAAA